MEDFAILNNGIQMPRIGLGTHTLPNEDMCSIIKNAYEVGYRKFDTAWLYNNEEYIGNAIKTLGLDRKELFITTKLHNDDLYRTFRYHHRIPVPHKSVRKAFFESCKRLRTDYIDLYLIHWPFANFEALWKEVVKLYKEGYIRAIGVSSFLNRHIIRLKEISDITPALNQYEINPYNTRKPLTKFCQEEGIQVEAYATFGTTFKNDVASKQLLEEPSITLLAEKYQKTASQIILRWAIQQDATIIPRSKSKQHLSENLDIFDFELQEDEMNSIFDLNEDKFSRGIIV